LLTAVFSLRNKKTREKISTQRGEFLNLQDAAMIGCYGEPSWVSRIEVE
jgi:hypothetical protein